jgi:hypothetical protein
MAVVARLMRGEPLEPVARETNVSIAKLTEWRERAEDLIFVNFALFSCSFAVMLFAMTLWSVQKAFAVLLAIFVTGGLSLSAAGASNMPTEMSVGGMTAAGHGGLHDCDSGGVDKSKAMTCAAMCAAFVFATLPQIEPMAVAEIMTTLALPEDEFLIGSGSPPDPYPPRSPTLANVAAVASRD